MRKVASQWPRNHIEIIEVGVVVGNRKLSLHHDVILTHSLSPRFSLFKDSPAHLKSHVSHFCQVLI